MHGKLVSILRNSLNQCNRVRCNLVPIANLHTTLHYLKRRKIGEEKKATRIIEYPKMKGELVDVWQNITLAELAQVLSKPLSHVQALFLHQVTHPSTQIGDIKVLQQAIRRSGHRMRIIGKPSDTSNDAAIDKDAYPRPPAPPHLLKPRPPVVTVMGHVDHGKTTLLDALRHSNVVASEFGGITQHIGAFNIPVDTPHTTSPARITFLDTPGHAAFTSMRSRGAHLTDIIILVVAADDGVMEQTLESIRMANEARVPLLVAINKIDAPKADVARTERLLAQAGVLTESQGGDVQCVPISALRRLHLGQLVEALVLQAELLDTRAEAGGPVEGVVVESRVHASRGRVCTVVVQRGTARRGCVLVAGTAMGRVRALRDEGGAEVREAGPGWPAEVEGWRGELPAPGERVLEVGSERRAREVVRVREAARERAKGAEDSAVISEKEAHHEREYRERLAMKRKMGRYRLRPEGPRKPEIEADDGGAPVLGVLIKTDVDGTLEALLDTLDTYSEPGCRLELVHYGVGAVTEGDVEMAKAFDAIVYAFNTETANGAAAKAELEGVVVRNHNVIYKMVDDVKGEINKRLPMREVEDVLGEASVLQLFEVSDGRRKVPVVGCRCVKGVLRKSAWYRVRRGDVVVFEGQLTSMRHLKNEVDVIKADNECGLQFQDKEAVFQAGDTLICFQMRKEPQVTSWDPGF